MDYINSFLSWQESFDHKPVLQYMRDHDEVLVFFIVMYLTLVFYIPEVLKKPVTFLQWPMTFWNFFLGAFSILGTYFIAMDFVKLVWTNGLFWSICTDPAKSHVDGTMGFWLMLFILSKIPELLDTAFLILLKKDVIFLQWFHHVATMCFCWYSYVHQTAPGWWFAAINYAVHAIMYNYFGLMAFKSMRPILKKVAPLITALQIIQMFVGVFVLIAQRYFYNNGEELYGRPCENFHDAANKLGLGMYFAYIVLFGSLFKKLYLSGGGKGKNITTKQDKLSSIQNQQATTTTAETVVLDKNGKTLTRKSEQNGANGQQQQRSQLDVDEEGLCNATAEAFREIHGSDPYQLNGDQQQNGSNNKDKME